jgi:HTH-type transcriptional regulator/antitoxin HigA
MTKETGKMAIPERELQQAFEAGAKLAPLLRPPANDLEYDRTVEFLNRLLDVAGDDENHPLAPLLHAVGSLVEEYDEINYPMDEGCGGIEMLKFFMDQHGLKQVDLIPEFGSASLISEALNGKRELNKKQITALSKRFQVSPGVFF